ncbi:MAG: Holliday junction branch migration protein RuvA [Erysipelotrichaceae bacterium]|jgi:Holliday junction DNA helicase RuvA|nr:Holliday junction branch migration protein RuvA [Bacillota bacterium]NLP22006.1 Holliday junction branch migration protein RuvA [Erysipelotrichaceae bacterium]HCY07172.1 Holliday junction branch migration protein RuvA [Erysipelotrichaceae bacterium]
MIAFIKGNVYAYGIDWVIIDNNGVGYKINFTKPDKLSLNKEILIYTYQHVREDDISLYGFLTLEEHDFFLKLINVKGVGPKSAMNILSKADYKKLIVSIENKDVNFLKTMPGVGAKTASQIILDLKGKLISTTDKKSSNDELNDALEGLKSLGYKQGEINSITNTLLKSPNLSSDEYLKLGLKLLMKKKMG